MGWSTGTGSDSATMASFAFPSDCGGDGVDSSALASALESRAADQDQVWVFSSILCDGQLCHRHRHRSQNSPPAGAKLMLMMMLKTQPQFHQKCDQPKASKT
jgi:hypothetical protein